MHFSAALTFQPPVYAPTGVVATGGSSIGLAWNVSASGNYNSTGFSIERSTDGVAGWTQIGRVGVGVRGFTDTAPVLGFTNYYRVREVNSAGAGPYSTVVSAATIPQTPQALAIQFNALATSHPDGGATARMGYAWNLGPTYQTISVNGAAPGGYGYCSKLENFISPGDNNHLRPDATINGGLGAACVASGRIEGAGLLLPAAAPGMASFIGHADPASAVSLANTVPNAFMQDATAGYTVILFHHHALSRKYFSFKRPDGTNEQSYGDIRSHRSMRDPTIGLGIPATQNGPKSKVLFSSVYAVHTQTTAVGMSGGNISFEVQEGSLVSDAGSNGALDYLDTARDFHLLADGAFSADGASGNLGVYLTLLCSGRPNKAQYALLRAYAKATNWDGNPYWVDRYRLANMGGDSMEAPNMGAYNDREGQSVYTHLDHITQGYLGRPAIANMVLTGFPRSGQTPAEYQEAHWRIFGTFDFTDRPFVLALVWEILNSGNYPNNKTLRAIVKAYDPKMQVWSFDTWGVANDTHNWDMEEAQRLADGWDGVLAMNRMQLWDPLFWRNGLTFDPNGPVLEIFDGSRHFQLSTYEHTESFWTVLLKLAAGEDATAQAVEVLANTPVIHLTSDAPTATPGWTAKNYLRQTLGTGSLVFESTNSSIASVHPTSGLVKAVAVGECGIRAIRSDGAMGMCVIFVDSVPVIPPDTTTGLLVDLTFEADTLADTSGSGLNFSAVGSPTFAATSGAAGSRSLVLGTADAFRHAMVTALQFLRAGHTNFAICVAVKPTDFSGVPFYLELTNFCDILDTGGGGAVLGRLFSSGGATVGSISRSNGAMTSGAYNFLALQVDIVANTMTLYYGSGSTTVSLTGTPNAAPSANLNFGAQGTPTPANFLKNSSWARVKIFVDTIKTPNDIGGVKTEFGV